MTAAAPESSSFLPRPRMKRRAPCAVRSQERYRRASCARKAEKREIGPLITSGRKEM